MTRDTQGQQDSEIHQTSSSNYAVGLSFLTLLSLKILIYKMKLPNSVVLNIK